jgi:hypothetical protein
MAHFRYIILCDPVVGREDEFRAWYADVHIPQVLEVPGFVAAQQFEVTDAGFGMPRRRRFLVIYEIEAEDPATVIAALQARSGTEFLKMSESLDRENVFARVFAPISDRMIALNSA